MNSSKIINYILIVIGCIVAIYAQAGEKQDVVVLILGIIILMFGLFRISSSIPRKKKSENDNDVNNNLDV
jgi:chromate transport protein ChrA